MSKSKALSPAVKKVPIGFNRIFMGANRTKRRYRVLYGSMGSGKSQNIAQDYIMKLSDSRYRGCNLLVIRRVEESNRYSTYAEMCKAIYSIYGTDAENRWRMTKTPLALKSLDTGNEVIFRGMADERQRDRIKSVAFSSGKLTWIWVEEATELATEDVEILDDRLRGDLPEGHYYQITFSFNPVSASHWIKARFFDVVSEMVYICHSTYLDNRWCDIQTHKRMMERKVRDPDGYKVYGLGEWGELGGLILTNIQVKEFETSPEYFDAMAIGQDFGFNHANAILTAGIKDGDVYICSEIYEYEKTREEIVKIAEARKLSKTLKMYCDSAEPGTIKMWRFAGYRSFAVVKEPGSVNAQITWLKDRKIYIHPSCIWTIKEIQAWKWQKDKETGKYIDEPVDFFDDAMAALRYVIEGWRGKRRFAKRNLIGSGLKKEA